MGGARCRDAEFMDHIQAMTRDIVERAKRYESDTVPGDFVTLATPCPVRRRGEGELQSSPARAATGTPGRSSPAASSRSPRSKRCSPLAASAR